MGRNAQVGENAVHGGDSRAGEQRLRVVEIAAHGVGNRGLRAFPARTAARRGGVDGVRVPVDSGHERTAAEPFENLRAVCPPPPSVQSR